MGPTRARDETLAQDAVKVLLQEKDARIAALEARLEAYSARASTAQTRLLKTIDVLDALRSQHALENAAEEQARVKLVHDVDRWRTVAKNLEVERDELKDVVEDLIEKAGCTSRNMQRGNLNVAFPEQVTAGAIDGTGTKDDHNNDLLGYASSIIARLRMELDFERQNHGRSVEEANLRIEELEAKVAVREAELEHCITSPTDLEHQPQGLRNVPSHAVKTRIRGRKLSEPKPLSDEECLRFLEGNNARNRSLEIEIRHIAERLEQIRMVTSTSSGEPPSSTPPNGHKSVPTPNPRARSASVDPCTLSRPSDIDGGKARSIPEPPSPSTMLSIAQLDNQIHAMTTQMDALVSERTTLIEASARQRRATDGINIEVFQDILRVEAECVRLQAEVDDLREQLQHTRARARDREKALLGDIAQLRASSSGTSVLGPALDLYHVFSPQPLEVDIAAEESMELASPLMPTLYAATSSHGPRAELDLLSFPISPKRARSSASASPATPPRTTRRSPGMQDVERVQVALDAARVHLAEKEDALAQLRVEMERLQRELEAQPLGDGDGDGG